MKSQVVSKLTVICSIVLMAAGAFAMEHGECDKHEGHGGSHECGCMKKHNDHDVMNRLPMMLKKKIGLTGKQAGEISDIMEAEHKEDKPLFEATHKERKALMDFAKTGDQAAVRKQAGKLADAETALAMHHAACHKKIAAVMTKEQAEKFEKLSAEFMEHKGSKGMECDKGHKKGHDAGDMNMDEMNMDHHE
jgi:Spy/CpxP family protein refolding chaperone